MTADELVEKVAREICAIMGYDPDDVMVDSNTGKPVTNWTIYASYARAAIAIVVEACANVAEGAHDRSGRQWVSGSLWDTLSRETAARIRSISPSSGSMGGE